MNRRRNYFIKKKFQADFLLKFVVLLLFEALVITLLFMFISRDTLTTAYSAGGLVIQRTWIFFVMSFLIIVCISGLGIGIAGLFVFMFLSHRIGGPLYKFEKTLEDAKSGDMSKRMQLRTTDELLDLKDSVNAFLEETDRRLSIIKKDLEGTIGLIEERSEKTDIEQIKRSLGRIKTSLDHFKTSE